MINERLIFEFLDGYYLVEALEDNIFADRHIMTGEQLAKHIIRNHPVLATEIATAMTEGTL